jgi:signal transduction histidine kinase
MKTKFAPPERASNEEITQQARYFENNDTLNQFLSRIPAIFIILNKYRQVVYMNEGALEFSGLDDVVTAIGKRPGEAFGCIHAEEEEAGCGTSESCTYCDAVNAVLVSQKGKDAVRDCRLILGPEETAFDLRIWARPLIIDQEQYAAVTLQDIRHEKRRVALEQIFFHDILNTITSLLGTVEMLLNFSDRVNQEEFLAKTKYITNLLVEEIRSQQLLNDAENNNLTPDITTFKCLDFLNEVINLYRDNQLTKEKEVILDEKTRNIEISSDRIILRRVVSNMLKNALEAAPEESEIKIGCITEDGDLKLWVHNPGYIPRNVQLQIFQRSFSTKGSNRGLGTYSMRLLSSYLKGDVSFKTSKDEGTTFIAQYPLKLEE